MKPPYSKLHIIVLLFMTTAIATAHRPMFYRGVPSSQRKVNLAARVRFEETWILAESTWKAREFEEALDLWQDATSQAEALYGKNHAATRETAAWVKRSESACNWNDGQKDDFEEFDRTLRNLLKRKPEYPDAVRQQLIKTAERLFGSKSLDCASICLSSGDSYLHNGQLEKAKTFLDRALAVCESELGASHLAYASGAGQLAKVNQLLGEMKRADHWVTAAKLAWTLCDVSANDRLNELLKLGLIEAACSRDAGEFNQMRRVLSRLAGQMADGFGKRSELYVYVCLRAASLQLSEPGRADAANAWFEEGTAWLKKLPIQKTYLLALRDMVAARVAIRSGDIERAHQLGEQARESYQKFKGQDEFEWSDWVDGISVCMDDIETMARTGKREEAREEMTYLLEGLAQLKRNKSFVMYEELSPQAIHTFRVLGEHQQAEKLAKEVLSEWEERVGKDAFRRARILRELGRVRHAEGRFADSEKCFLEALDIEAKSLGQDSAGRIWTLNAFAEMLQDWGKAGRVAEIKKQIAKFNLTFEPPKIPISPKQGGGSFSNEE